MSNASDQIGPAPPFPLSDAESAFIKETVMRFYGENAVVRNFGSDPKRMDIHVETDVDPDMRKYDCLGVLLTRIERDQISLEVTKRCTKVRGNAKLAYRQGTVL